MNWGQRIMSDMSDMSDAKDMSTSSDQATLSEETQPSSASSISPASSVDQPVAVVAGKPVLEIPQDLYIPPDALKVILETFSGPLDLLLYLIRRHNLDILDIPIAKVTEQYMKYIELMDELQLELAAEYLVMAATLAEIKSRMLLPKPVLLEEGEEEDPRAELVRRLQEYERFKLASEDLNALPQLGRDIFEATAQTPDWEISRPLPDVNLNDLLTAFKSVLEHAEMMAQYHVERESLSVRERMGLVLDALRQEKFISFNRLFSPKEGRLGVVVTLIAILELTRQSLIDIVQGETFGSIHLKATEHHDNNH